MSPTKKKTKKTPTKKTARKTSATKKATAKKAPKKKAAKKKSKKTASKKVSSKAKAPAAKARLPAIKGKLPAAAKKKAPAPAKKAAAETTKQATARHKAPAKAPKGKLVPLSQIPHPKYGLKFECFSCATRFYVMGRPEPVCPKCGADQRERPRVEKKVTPKPRRPAVRPMAPLLDDDEEAAPAEELDRSTTRGAAEPDAMFDDAEAASVSEDAEETPPAKGPAREDD